MFRGILEVLPPPVINVDRGHGLDDEEDSEPIEVKPRRLGYKHNRVKEMKINADQLRKLIEAHMGSAMATVPELEDILMNGDINKINDLARVQWGAGGMYMYTPPRNKPVDIVDAVIAWVAQDRGYGKKEAAEKVKQMIGNDSPWNSKDFTAIAIPRMSAYLRLYDWVWDMTNKDVLRVEEFIQRVKDSSGGSMVRDFPLLKKYLGPGGGEISDLEFEGKTMKITSCQLRTIIESIVNEVRYADIRDDSIVGTPTEKLEIELAELEQRIEDMQTYINMADREAGIAGHGHYTSMRLHRGAQSMHDRIQDMMYRIDTIHRELDRRQGR